ncbi:MAG: pyrroloquinoline quinone-dependent dehydrogenase [Rhodospirillaceae bacterium]|nr:pyrroloquinoline quinone-dependent dehydrogenase [Rhodospirillaceae bacterium]
MAGRFGAVFGFCVTVALSAAADELAANRGWASLGGTAGGGQYSALDQIHRGNVGQLKQVWTHSSGDAARIAALGKKASYEVTPILAEGALFICTPTGRVISLDPRTGAENWAFDPFDGLIAGERTVGTCRGVTYWRDDAAQPSGRCAARIFRAEYAGRLYALDAKTGQPCADFGQGGVIDTAAAATGGNGRMRYTSPVSVWRDVVIAAGSIGDNIRANQPDGVIRGFDARTGALRWRIATVPEHMSEQTGNADVWPPYAVDNERGLVFVPTGSPSPDFYGANRNEDMPLANALLAIDAATGAIKWRYQIVHHDLFDYDLPAQPILADVTRAGRKIPAVIQITKMGTVFVFHRETGEPLFPIEERPVPASDIPGERSSPTQPVPVAPKPFAPQTLAEADVFGLTPWDRAKCVESFRSLRYEGPFTPASLKGSLMLPAPIGGGNWGGAAFDPARNRLIVKTQNFAYAVKLIPASDPNIPDVPETAESRMMEGTPYFVFGRRWLSPFGVPCNPPPWGELIAIDLDEGAHLWRRTVGQVPFGPGKILKSPAAWGSPVVGGPMLTAGGLIFMAATMDPVFRAYDIDTGAQVWSAPLPVPGMAVPMTYEIDGKQYVVIAAGGSALAGTALGDRLVAFALP